jgi:hypothetical protein
MKRLSKSEAVPEAKLPAARTVIPIPTALLGPTRSPNRPLGMAVAARIATGSENIRPTLLCVMERAAFRMFPIGGKQSIRLNIAKPKNHVHQTTTQALRETALCDISSSYYGIRLRIGYQDLKSK